LVDGKATINVERYNNGPLQSEHSMRASAGMVKVIIENGANVSTITFDAKKDFTPPNPEDVYYRYLLFETAGVTWDQVAEEATKAAHEHIFKSAPENYFTPELALAYKNGKSPPAIDGYGDGFKFNIQPESGGLVSTTLVEARTLNPMPPSSFHIPAKVVLECIVSVVYKHDSFKGMLSCKKVRFVKKLADEDFTQLNEIGEIPDEEADYFMTSTAHGEGSPTGGGSKADVAGQTTPKSTGGGGKASKKQKR
jgi:hypothetical protein